MKKYEIMYILKANLEEEARKAEIENLHSILTLDGGKITNVNEWGLRDFAYEINKETKGYYVVVNAECSNEATKEFQRLGRINKNLVRYLITVDVK